MPDELALNLLFSATYEQVAYPLPGVVPARELRIAHNYARRLLAELYGQQWETEMDRRRAVHLQVELSVALQALRAQVMALQ